MLSISERIADMYKSIADVNGENKEGKPFSRYKSWEYCHEAFKNARSRINLLPEVEKKKEYDTLALHLAFYLASWGMYRGSSFLLQRDYKAHISAVKAIMEMTDDILWDYDPHEHSAEDDICVSKKIMELKKKIIASYGTIEERDLLDEEMKYSFTLIVKTTTKKAKSDTINRKVVIQNGELKKGTRDFELTPNGQILYKGANLNFDYRNFSLDGYDRLPECVLSVECDESFSETLVTKILMGTIGSVPAYDRFFKDAIKKSSKIKMSNVDESITSNLIAQFNESGLVALYGFVRNDYVYGELMRVPTTCIYPVMKRVDMYFWQYGYELGFLACKKSRDDENELDIAIDKDKDSPLIKLLKKREQQIEWTPQDFHSERKIKAQLEKFISECSELEDYYKKLIFRNSNAQLQSDVTQ